MHNTPGSIPTTGNNNNNNKFVELYNNTFVA
jgi:hypothetical protein